MTSLLTLEGEVAITKSSKNIETRDSKSIDIVESELNSPKVLSVKKGRFSNFTPETKKFTRPIIINTKQFVAIKKNEDLVSDSERPPISEEEIKKEEASIKSIKDSSLSKTNLIEDGGLVDLTTGLYVKTLNNNQLVGSTDLNGNYIPPQGMSLSPKQGFILDKTKIKNEDEKKELKKKIKELNERNDQNIKKIFEENKKLDEVKNEDLKVPSFYVSLSGIYTKYEFKTKSDGAFPIKNPESDYFIQGEFEWKWGKSKKWGLWGQTRQFEHNFLGIKYYLRDFIHFHFSMGEREIFLNVLSHFENYTSSGVQLGASLRFWKNEKFSFWGKAQLIGFKKLDDHPDFTIEDSGGLLLSLYFDYFFNSQMGIEVFGEIENMRQKGTFIPKDTNMDKLDFESEIQSTSLGVKCFYLF